MKIAWVLPDIGWYHASRLKAVVAVPGVFALAVETTGQAGFEAFRADDAELQRVERRLVPQPLGGWGLLQVSAFQAALGGVLAQWRPDVVCVHGWVGTHALSPLAWCRENGVPAVLMSDSTAQDEPRRRWKESVKRRVVGLYSAALVGGTPHVEYAAALGMPRERIFTGYDGVDNDHFAAGAAAARARGEALRAQMRLPQRYFLASNRFIEKKNLPRLLGAFARYRRQAGDAAWDLVLLGDGPLRPALERQVRSLGLEGCVHLPGFKQYQELPAYYGLAGAFVHASTTEQWGLVVNEAMAAGLPVIVSQRCGCAPDLVAHGENGFAFDPYDEDALAQCLLRMAGEECDRAAMGAASARSIARWTPRTFAENLLRAAQAAQAGPVRRAGALDRALLWALAHR